MIDGTRFYEKVHSVTDSGEPFVALPEYVKEASERDLSAPDDLPPALFADPVKKRYPCHTKAATWKSALDLYEGGPPAVSAVEKRLRAAAGVFGILADVESVKQACLADRREADLDLDNGDFGLILEKTGGQRHRHLPIRNAEEVKAAEDYLHRYRDRLRYDLRRGLADKIIEKSASFGCPLSDPDAVERIAGLGTCAPSQAAEMLYLCARQVAPRDKEAAAAMTEVAISVLERPELSARSESMQKVAKLLDTAHHDYRLPAGGPSYRPEDRLFVLTHKVAAEAASSHCQLQTGSCYEKSAISSIPVDRLRGVFGDDFVDNVAPSGFFVDGEKLASIVETLPRGDAELFDQLARECGVKTAYVERPEGGPLSSPEALHRLAAAHSGQR